MVHLKRIHPYFSNGKSALTHLQKKSGVYLIYENDRVVYVGHSRSNLYKTITRHFQAWDDPTQRRVTYVNGKLSGIYTVKVYLTKPSDAPILEEKYIMQYLPRDNEEKIEMATERQMERVNARAEQATYIAQADIENYAEYRYARDGGLLD